MAVEEANEAIIVRIQRSALTGADVADLHDAAVVLGPSALVVVDLSELQSIDAAGIGALVAWRRRLAQEGSQLRLAAPGRSVANVLELLRLHRLFEIYGHVEDGLRADGIEAP